jgi:23S rRNA G2069 N7-methylase RlmK/C1962 C5-methylase RlmI
LPLPQLLQFRLQQAKQLRNITLGLPNLYTTVYRLVNGEGDRLSGLVIDMFNEETLVVQSSAAWTERYRDIIESSLLSLYEKSLPSIVWLSMDSRLKQEGWTITSDKNLDADTPSGTKSIRVLENDISYEVVPGHGQKTGFYCDQRDNRQLMRSFSKGMYMYDVLAYSCTGKLVVNAGFVVNDRKRCFGFILQYWGIQSECAFRRPC